MFVTNLALDVKQIRAETPGLQHVVHFNNAGACLRAWQAAHVSSLKTQELVAGAALPTKQVLTAQQEFLELEANIGGYAAMPSLHLICVTPVQHLYCIVTMLQADAL